MKSPDFELLSEGQMLNMATANDLPKEFDVVVLGTGKICVSLL